MGVGRNAFSEVFMIPLPTAVSGGFTFTSNCRGFELRQGDQMVATLNRPRIWSSEVVAAAAGQNWVIHRSGFWSNKAEIMDAASQQQVAVFKSGWGGKGALVFTDGQKFFVVTRGCWYPVWTVTSELGDPVFQLHSREKSVELHNVGAISESRLSLLVLFTLYRVRQAEQAAAVAAAAAS